MINPSLGFYVTVDSRKAEFGLRTLLELRFDKVWGFMSQLAQE
jgi:hypothetical protein